MRILCSLLLAPAAFGLPLDSSEIPHREVPRPSSYADVVEKAQKSVVSVYPATLLTESEGEDEAFLDRYFGRTGEDEGKRISGHGSGVIVGADGLILTNNHVVRTASGSLADEIVVELHTGRRHPATIVGTDPPTDIAVLKMEPSPDGPPLPIADSSNVRVGDLVFAIGNPFEVGMTVTMGCVSATRRRGLNLSGPGSFEDFLQTDASINPGNSGGALVDAAGRLVGINTAIRSAGGGSVGIGFAVPSRLAAHVADHLVAHGRVIRSRLGVSVTTAKPDNNAPGGARIASVETASPAAKAGLRPGDIIVAIDDMPVPDEAALRLYSSLMPPGVEKPVSLWRDGKRETCRATFEEIPANDNTEGADGAAEVLRGVALRPIDQPQGLRIDTIKSGSPHDGRLQVGQIILEINGTKTTSLAAARNALKRGVNQLRVHHEGASLLVALRIMEE